MAAVQVEVIVWLDPPLMGDFPVGSTVTHHAAFRDPITKVLADPGTVIFRCGVPGSLVSTTAPNAAIIKDAVGQYHMLMDLTTAGKYMMQAIAQDGSGNDEGIGAMIVTVYDTGA